MSGYATEQFWRERTPGCFNSALRKTIREDANVIDGDLCNGRRCRQPRIGARAQIKMPLTMS